MADAEDLGLSELALSAIKKHKSLKQVDDEPAEEESDEEFFQEKEKEKEKEESQAMANVSVSLTA